MARYAPITGIPTLLLILTLTLPASVPALEPEEILVVANMNASQSRGLAKYYMKKRQIPEKNLVLLFVTDGETCTREAYEKKAVPPIRRALDAAPDIRAIVTIYGVPLRIASPGHTPREKKKLTALESKKNQIKKQRDDTGNSTPEDRKKTDKRLSGIEEKIRGHKRQFDKTASFDSELMLVKRRGYPLNMWIINPYYLGLGKNEVQTKKSEVIMVSRLDAADPDIVKRIINDSLAAEKNGLNGSAYFDARYKHPGEKKVSGYSLYDRSIHRAAEILSRTTAMKVVLDDTNALFRPGESPDTALYCGWYSLARYIDAFTWQQGAVGFHIASAECTTLRNPGSRVWCKKMLDNGAAATIGPVGEPYVQAFPMPEIFFRFLSEGYLTLAESYLVSLPYLSWKMVLVGDPLYRVNLKKMKKG